MFRNRCGRGIAAAMALALLTSACTTTGGAPVSGPGRAAGSVRMSAAAAELRQQQVEYQRIQEGTVTGAVVGGLIGAGLGAALGGRNRGQAALLGGMLGAGVGAAAGNSYAQNVNAQTRQISAQQGQYRAVIQDADRNIAHFRKINASASRLVADETARISQLNAQYASGKLTAKQYQDEIGSARENLALLASMQSQIDNDIAVVDRAAGQGSAEARARAAQLRAQKAQLEAQHSRLLNAYKRVPSGVGGVS